MIAKVRRRSTSVAKGDRAGAPSGCTDGHVHGRLDVVLHAGQIKLCEGNFFEQDHGLLRRPAKTHSGENVSGQRYRATTKAKPDPAPAPKSEAAPAKDKSTSGEAAPKTESSETATAAPAAPKDYSRGEGQKPVSAAYRENWNAIFAKKGAKKKKR